MNETDNSAAPAAATEDAAMAPAYAVPAHAVVHDDGAFTFKVKMHGAPEVRVSFRNRDECDAAFPGVLNAPIVLAELAELARLVEAGAIEAAQARVASHVRPLLA